MVELPRPFDHPWLCTERDTVVQQTVQEGLDQRVERAPKSALPDREPDPARLAIASRRRMPRAPNRVVERNDRGRHRIAWRACPADAARREEAQRLLGEQRRVELCRREHARRGH